jgi:hypothetical protein
MTRGWRRLQRRWYGDFDDLWWSAAVTSSTCSTGKPRESEAQWKFGWRAREGGSHRGGEGGGGGGSKTLISGRNSGSR